MKLGVHKGRCVDAVMTVKGKNKRECVALKFARSDELQDTGIWYGWFGDNDAGGKSVTQRTFDALRLCGLEDDDLTHLDSCKRREVELVVQMDDFNGVSEAKIRFVQAPGTAASFMPEAMSGDKAAQFAERMRKRIRGEKPDYGMADEGAPRGGDDDIPF